VADDAFHLHIQTGSRVGQDHVLSGPSLTIGRYPLADIVIDEPDVSYRHAVLTRGGDTYRIADLNSDAGTYVNGRRVGAEPVDLIPGDILLFGANVSAAFLASEPEPAMPSEEPVMEATPAPQRNIIDDGREGQDQPIVDEPGQVIMPATPTRLPIHDEPLPEMPPPQKSNNQRIVLILAGCLLLLGCCCSATLFMYFIGGDWLLSQMGLLP
jgi:hypothetical protein